MGKKLLNFIFWPAVAGLVFGLVVLQLPRLAEYVPGLAAYMPGVPVQQVTSNSYSYAEAFSKAAPAVVSINSTAEVGRYMGTQRINPFVSRPVYSPDESSSLGSGVIISPEGYIITSLHIFELQDPELVRNPNDITPKITVTLYDGRSVGANIVAVDDEDDLTLLKIDENNLAYMTPAEEYTLDEGDIVLAIGNPRNIGQSVTLGIISALLSTGDSYVIQTDAAINPGNSGGALIDVNGKLVGINSTIVSESGGSEGISFAVPAAKAYELMQAYIESDPGAYLGVEGSYVTDFFSRLMLDANTGGMWIERVSKNGPAEKAGLKANDVIVSLGDIDIHSEQDAILAVQTVNDLEPGDTVTARVDRAGEILSFEIVLGVGEAVLYYTENEQFLDPNPFESGLLR